MFSFTSSRAFLDQIGIHADLFRYLLIGGLIFTRIFVTSLFVPFLGGRPVPQRIRITVAFTLMMFLYVPISSGTTTVTPDSTGVIFAFFLKEMLVGILLGMPLVGVALRAVALIGVTLAGDLNAVKRAARSSEH